MNAAGHPAAAWHYFLLFCDDGTRIAGALAKSGGVSEVWLSIYGGEPAAFDVFFPLAAYQTSPRGCSLRSNFLFQEGERVWLRLAEQDVRIEVSGRSLIDWPDHDIVWAGGDSRVDWKVPVLRAEFEGRLTVRGRQRAIRGLMFHDAVSHDLPLNAPRFLLNFRYWTWGLLYGGDRTVLFVDVNSGIKPFRFLCDAGPDGIVSSNAGIDPEDLRIGYEGGYPHRTIRLDYGDRPLEITLTQHHPVFHGGWLGRLLMRLFKPKYHSRGIWRRGDEAGEAYVESLRLR